VSLAARDNSSLIMVSRYMTRQAVASLQSGRAVAVVVVVARVEV
jgi:hypothetical protein